ncbi:unnamed protein product [Pylaiella littoralis]
MQARKKNEATGGQPGGGTGQGSLLGRRPAAQWR